MTAEAQRVGGECRKGQDLELAELFSPACLLSLGNANQTTCEPLPSLSPQKKV